MAASIWLNTFGGRKKEWEIMTYAHCKGQLDANLNHVICSNHKTAPTYGDLAKLLTPGVFKSFQCYSDDLPRPADCETFLVPATPNAPKVCLSSCLRTFCRKNVPRNKAMPKVNLMRKLFHKQLMKLTETREGLKSVMKIIDAHSESVQEKHYCLREPEEDVKLAQHLVDAVLGATVPWPSEAEVDAFEQEQGDELAKILEGIIDEHNEGNNEEEDGDDEEEMLSWKNGFAFGVIVPGMDLAPLGDEVAGGSALPLRDVDVSDPLQALGSYRQVPGSSSGIKRDPGAPAEGPDNQKKVKLEKTEQPKNVKKEHCSPADDVGLSKHEYYAKFAYVKSPGNKRTSVDPGVHDIVINELLKWQQENNQDPRSKPNGEWCWDLRCELIKRDILTRYHCWDVCRNPITKYIKEQTAKLAKANEDVD